MKDGSKKIHQLVHTLSYGDAISGEALALKRCFKEKGIESEIYAINIDPKLRGQATLYKELDHNFEGSLILHYSLGSPLNDIYRKVSRAKKFLVYHNLTPWHWFSRVNSRIVEDIQSGQKELPELCEISDALVSDSIFNAGELKNLGFDSTVLELPLDPARWDQPANSGIESILKGSGKVNIMHVGRLAPNKCIEDIIKSFFYLHHKIDKNSHLWLVGIDIDTEVYSFALKRLVYELSLSEAVSFVGRFADSELKALYQNADVYLCASEHEGFCMPVIEAMHFGVPVIAYASSALPDTIKSGGILVKEKDHPKIAELTYELAKNQTLRSKVVAAGYERAGQLSYQQFTEQALNLFQPKLADIEMKEALQA